MACTGPASTLGVGAPPLFDPPPDGVPASRSGGDAGVGAPALAEPLQPHDCSSLQVKPGPQLASSVHGNK
jgi:hypothetical protein